MASPAAYEALAGLVSSSLDSTESGNALRMEKIQAGLREVDRIPMFGYGLDVLTPRSGFDTFINFENTYLNAIGAIGVGGYALSLVCIVVLAGGSFLTIRRVLREPGNSVLWLAAALGPSWFAYSMVFPCFRGRMSGYYMWVILLLVLECLRTSTVVVKPQVIERPKPVPRLKRKFTG
jgi:hypothetical protein